MAKLLRVFYGWAKINKIRKKEAISVIFENDGGFEKNEKKVKLYQKYRLYKISDKERNRGCGNVK